MKKIFLVFAISTFFIACNDGATTDTELTTNSTTTISVDSASATIDTTDTLTPDTTAQ